MTRRSARSPSRHRIFTIFVTINRLLFEEAEDVIEDKIAVWLFGKEKSLNKFPPSFTTVGHFTDNLDYNAAIRRRLSVNRVNEDLTILETDRCNAIMNFLLTEARFSILTFGAVNERGSFGVETMQSIWLLVHKSIILRNKLPSDFRRNDIVVDLTRIRHDEDRKRNARGDYWRGIKRRECR